MVRIHARQPTDSSLINKRLQIKVSEPIHLRDRDLITFNRFSDRFRWLKFLLSESNLNV
jgi:hypothetical protein